MFDKLNAVLDRFRELDEEIAQPEVIQDYEKYQACDDQPCEKVWIAFNISF